MSILRATLAVAVALFVSLAFAADKPLPQLEAYTVPDAWRQPIAPLQLADHTWYIGTESISALLIDTPEGAIVIDGGMPQAADMIIANLRTVGVAPERVRW